MAVLRGLMKTKRTQTGPTIVNINVMEDGTVALVFSHTLLSFTGNADEMTQLGVNLIKASQIASVQHPQFETRQPMPLRKM